MPQGLKPAATDIPGYATGRHANETPDASQTADAKDIAAREEVTRKSNADVAAIKAASNNLLQTPYSLAHKMRSGQ
jgi:hypothetical protein